MRVFCCRVGSCLFYLCSSEDHNFSITVAIFRIYFYDHQNAVLFNHLIHYDHNIMTPSVITMINASTSSKAKKNGDPAAIQNKVQETVAVHYLSWVYMLPSMKVDDLHKKMSSAYHGDEKASIILFSMQCLSGAVVFSSLWDLEEDGSGVSTLSMKVLLSHLIGKMLTT